MIKYPKGSEWYKWDLHIHSNASDGNGSPKEIIEEAVTKGLKVIALTDHHTAKNIDNIKEYAKQHDITVISGIEFRTEYGSESVHIIGLFPDEHKGVTLNAKNLYDCILAKLGLTEAEIIAKGKNCHEKISDEDAFKKGIFCVQVDFKLASKLIREHGGIVTVHAGGKSNSIENMKHDGKGSSNTRNIENSLGPLKQELLSKYVDICELSINEQLNACFYAKNYNKPSIIASDAHKVNNIGDRFVWIKADPNINGLKQAIIEHDRIYIGESPPSTIRMNNNPTKVISNLEITNSDSNYIGEFGEWFHDVSIDFNPEMTVIIGNKGSGKTAVAEILALLGNTKCENDFVFLNKNKFRKTGYASNFHARIKWLSGTTEPYKRLDTNVDTNKPETIHFIAQNSFEKHCNNLAKDFEQEINNVVFSRLDSTDQRGYKNFNDLFESQNNAIDNKIEQNQEHLNRINNEIIELELLYSKDIKEQLSYKLAQVIEEFDAHKKTEPLLVSQPQNLNTEEYEPLISKRDEINDSINSNIMNMTNIKRNLDKLNGIKENIINLQNYIKTKTSDFDKELKEFEIPISEVIALDVNFSKIDETISKYSKDINTIEQQISEKSDKPGQLRISLKEINDKIDQYNKQHQGKLTDYNNYIKNKQLFDQKTKSLERSRYEIENKIKYIVGSTTPNLSEDIESKRQERFKVFNAIYECHSEKSQLYNKLKKPLDEFLNTYDHIIGEYRISIDTSISLVDKFIDEFSSKYINNAISSSFKGEDGFRKFKGYFDGMDLNDINAIKNGLSDIQSIIDDRFNDCNHKIFKKDMYLTFLNSLYGLEFIETKYQLLLQNKPLTQLSPGERGSLLLIFYLLLDARDIPLIIDQPEDNLDNQSIAQILVPFIKEAKKRRQIILVTHNANLAVVSDAEQIVRVKLNKDSNTFSFESGSLESYMIDDVVDVLEGTFTSFDIRKHKYSI